MIDITNVETFGWKGAIRGMRNSRQSWDKSDTDFDHWNGNDYDLKLGPEDLKLASKLASLGGSDAKFRRMIHVQMDILGPLYWWKEFDTYKIATVSNSTSTMYSITSKEFTIDNFEKQDMMSAIAGMHMIETVEKLNDIRTKYLETDQSGYKKMYWKDLIQLLPSSYKQLRTIDMNYEVLARMCRERMFHKLTEWQDFCRVMFDKLPYAKELIFCDRNLE